MSNEELYQVAKSMFPDLTQDQMMFDDTSEEEAGQIHEKFIRRAKADMKKRWYAWAKSTQVFPSIHLGEKPVH